MALLRVFGLWAGESKGGNKYLSGKWGEVRVIAFRNKSDNPKAPLYNVYFSVPDEGQQYGRRSDGDAHEGATGEVDEPRRGEAEADDDEAPF